MNNGSFFDIKEKTIYSKYVHTKYSILASYYHLMVWYYCVDIFFKIFLKILREFLETSGGFFKFQICISFSKVNNLGKTSGIIFSRIGGNFWLQNFCKTIFIRHMRRILFLILFYLWQQLLSDLILISNTIKQVAKIPINQFLSYGHLLVLML